MESPPVGTGDGSFPFLLNDLADSGSNERRQAGAGRGNGTILWKLCEINKLLLLSFIASLFASTCKVVRCLAVRMLRSFIFRDRQIFDPYLLHKLGPVSR